MAILAKITIAMSLGLAACIAFGQPPGEAGEPTPEALDAAFTSEDAARVAAGFSDEVIDPVTSDPIGDMTARADLVFRGNVVAQTYEYDARGTPYTHTTFSISESLKGVHLSDRFTLVQPGGPSSTDEGSIMIDAHAQYFALGEEELLFVKLDPGNRVEAQRARVENRFRIFGDRVYNEDGHGVTLEPLPGGAYRLALSQRPNAAPRFRRIDVGSHRLNKQFVDKAGRGEDRADRGRDFSGDESAEPQVIGADVETFSDFIRQ